MMLCYVMSCYVVLCYVMLCYVMSCYVVLCYVVLCCVRCGGNNGRVNGYAIIEKQATLNITTKCWNSILNIIVNRLN